MASYVVWQGKITEDADTPDYRVVRVQETNAITVEEGGFDAMGAEAWNPVSPGKPEWPKALGMALDAVVQAYGPLHDAGGGQ